MKPRAMILHATGTNRDHDVARALELAGAAPEIVHINQMRDEAMRLSDYQMLVLPGGFSYGDDLGAGKLWAVAIRSRFGADLDAFIAAGKPVIGICNGFQALVKSGLLPGIEGNAAGAWTQQATLTRNESGRFECRWVELAPEGTNIWTRDLETTIYCPVAHGEGRFVAQGDTLAEVERANLVAVRYVGDGYPANPNGSLHDIAGIANPAGNVLGLMPHPENHIVGEQHPQRHHGPQPGSGLPLFENGVRHAAGT
ncbi:MAG: phosphoribosylformylglycinamidine synthase I [Acidimicrobiia bacterium]|nr:phosphoribosylformylglycinamidine synthase I [Acidimicrobiia bacterium]